MIKFCGYLQIVMAALDSPRMMQHRREILQVSRLSG